MGVMLSDTIVAASSPGAGGGEGVRAIVRVSGAAARRVAKEVVDLPGRAVGRGYIDGLDLRGWGKGNALAAAMLFEGPRSFTGEDVVELHVPNSAGLVRWVIEAMLAAGRRDGADGGGERGGEGRVRMAGPGEFSARAFFNGKMDLTEAEGVAATISASSQVQLRAAASLRAGDLHRWTRETTEQLAHLLALVEAGIDFAEEEGIRFIEPAALELKLCGLCEYMQQQLAAAVRIDRLDDLPTVVFIGKPNVGKSSLINALAGQQRSIVSPVAGTTRDLLAVVMPTREGAGGGVRLVDVPGEEPAVDELRAKMMEAREQALLDADLIIEVVTDEQHAVTTSLEDASYAARCFRVQNKVDLLAEAEVTTLATSGAGWTYEACMPWQLVSARTGFHVGELRAKIVELVARRESAAADRLVLNHRHRAVLEETVRVLDYAGCLVTVHFEKHPELVASELRRGLDLLGEITGTISPDEVLGRIFSTFCIGK